ncbi:MAG: DinB family protein [Acidobacteriales bacterium]|nr:DinB family protein [Terriglobales bacterium]
MRGTPARLEDLLRGWPREILIKKPPQIQKIAQAQNKAIAQAPENGKWSAQEHAGHLLDLDPLWLARVGDFEHGATELTEADLTNRQTHEANHNTRRIEEILAGFRAARRKLLDKLEQMGDSSHGRTASHPRLKTPMRLVHHLYFVAEHDDHHLAHIWALLRARVHILPNGE